MISFSRSTTCSALYPRWRATVFHLHNAGSGIGGGFPFVVGDFLLPRFGTLLIELSQVFIGRSLIFLDQALFLHQPGEIRLPVFAGVLADDRFHRCVRFQHGRIDSHRLPFQQAMFADDLQEELKDLLVNLQRQPVTNARQAAVVRCFTWKEALPETDAVTMSLHIARQSLAVSRSLPGIRSSACGSRLPAGSICGPSYCRTADRPLPRTCQSRSERAAC